MSESLLRNLELGDLLTLGLLIVALAFGALRAILALNKAMGKRALQSQEARSEARAAAHSLSFFRNREAKKAELEAWLLERGAATPEAILACYAADEKKRELESPWYAKILVGFGVWLGSGLALAAFTLLVFGNLRSTSVLGLFGLVLCGLSIQIGQGKTPALRALGQVLGICGLIYAALLFDFDERPTSLLLCALSVMFWLLKPPFTARLAACLGALACLFFWLGDGYHSYYYFTGDSGEQLLAPGAIWHVKTLLYCLGLLWSAHYLAVMDGLAPAWLKKPAGEWLAARFDGAGALGASAYACLIFFAGLALSPHLPYLDQSGINPLMPWLLNLRLGTAALFAVLSVLLAWHFPAARPPALVLGPILALAGWFAPYLALGFGLLFLAFHTGRSAFLGAAAAYLGYATCLYYYNLDLSLFYKSLVLMGSGLVLLALSLGIAFLTRERMR